MRMYAGTSGYSYVEWRGSFYPEKMKPKDMLPFYASKLPGVELNNTFYRMPKAPMITGWDAATPPDFRFVLKASRRITHFSKLKDTDDSLSYLLALAAPLGEKLGPFLFQLPPQFALDLERLKDFLAKLPKGTRAAFEFRHPTWFTDEVFAALADAGAALCGGDLDEAKKNPPLVRSAPYGYLRLRRTEYSDADIAKWVETIGAQGWDECYAFFKHEELGPALAMRLNAEFS
jgi:uncharacterized protein YecE (DUF72 family)